VIYLIALSLLLVAGAAQAEPGKLRTFEDWIVGCDNAGACIAIGFSPEEIETLAYLRIARDAGTGAQPVVSVAILNDISSKGPIRLSLPEGRGELPVTTLAIDDPWAGFGSIPIGATDHRAFIDALLPAEDLVLTLDHVTSNVSLRGMTAALRHMDVVQGRVDADDALIATGDRPTGTGSVPQSLPSVAAMKIEELPPSAARPDGLPPSDEFCPDQQRDYVIDTGTGMLIWGVCISGGAYNLIYDLFVVADGTATPADPGPLNASFWNQPGAMLVSPVLLEDGRSIMSFDRGRGPGDCGAISYWAFDGEKLVPTQLAVMNVCRGVPPGEWPVLYRTNQSPERAELEGTELNDTGRSTRI
jgi:hypothetical protein